MKKSFLFLLISIMTVFLIAGCADDTTNGDGETTTPPTVVPIDPSNPSSLTDLLGNYEIVFFHTDGAGTLSISSDCTQVEYYTGKADAKCVQGNNNVAFKGYGVISLDNPTQPTTINITTKMQMTNDKFKTGTDILWSMAKNNQYNYTVFTPIPVTAIANGAVNDGVNAVTGVTGRHLTENTNVPETTYKFELLSDGSIRNTMVDHSVIPANVTVIMKKIDTFPSDYTLDKNIKFPEPVIEGFVDNPATATTTTVE